MKKTLAILLAAALLTVSLTGCSSKNNSGKFRVAMECSYAPYNWTQEDNSNNAAPIADSNEYANGYDVMMAQKIAAAMGKKLEVVKLDWDSLIPALQSGDVDAVIAGQSITAKRQQVVDFSTPYYYASIVTLTLKNSKYASAKGIDDLAGGTCTSQIGTIWYDNCLPQIKNANVLAAQETAPSMLVALESGTVDYVVCDVPTAMAAVKVYSDMTMLDFTGTDGNFQVSDEDVNLGISVQKGNSKMLKKINDVLAGMTTDDFETMMDQAISIQPLSANN